MHNKTPVSPLLSRKQPYTRLDTTTWQPLQTREAHRELRTFCYEPGPDSDLEPQVHKLINIATHTKATRSHCEREKNTEPSYRSMAATPETGAPTNQIGLHLGSSDNHHSEPPSQLYRERPRSQNTYFTKNANKQKQRQRRSPVPHLGRRMSHTATVATKTAIDKLRATVTGASNAC